MPSYRKDMPRSAPIEEEGIENFDSVLECNRFMLENEVACDITFHVSEPGGSEEVIKAHKYVLISRNPVFRRMFCGGLAEKGNEVCIPDINPVAFRKIIRYMYCESIVLTGDDVVDVIYAAKKYMMNQVVHKCFQFLRESLSVDNVCTILDYAIFFEEHDLQNQCLKLISTNTATLVESEQLLSLSKEGMRKIVKLETLSIKETDFFQLCLNWAYGFSEARDTDFQIMFLKDFLGDSFYHLRLAQLSDDDMTMHVLGSGLLNKEEEEHLTILRRDGISGKGSPFITKPRRMREAGKFTCELRESILPSKTTYCKSALIHIIKVTDDIDIHGFDIVDVPGSYLNGIQIKIVQNNSILFNYGVSISAGRKMTNLGNVIPIDLPKLVKATAGEIEIHLNFKTVGTTIARCIPRQGIIDIGGVHFEVYGKETFHISSFRFSIK